MTDLIFKPDASNWHLSGTQSNELLTIFDYVVDEYKLIKDKELAAIDDKYVSDYLYYLIHGGRELLLEPLRDLQPKSFEVLNNYASKYKMGFLWKSIIPAPHLPKINFVADAFFEVNNRVIFISVPIWPDKYFGGDKEKVDVMPEVLTNSWLRHGAGWGIGRLPLPRLDYRQLIGNFQGNAYAAEWVLGSFGDGLQKKLLPIMLEKVPNFYVTHYNPHDGTPSVWNSMRCFLDTRPCDLGSKCGDQFFVVDSLTDKVVYHIHNGDVVNLRILDPDGVGEAMDAYCAHTLMRTEGRFDFLPWSRIL